MVPFVDLPSVRSDKLIKLQPLMTLACLDQEQK